MKAIGLSVFIVLLLGVSAAQSELAPKTLSLCDLTRDPSSYDGKLVNVKAILASGPEGGIAFDDHCSVYALPAFSKTQYRFGSPLDKRLVSILRKHREAEVSVIAVFIDGKARIFGNQNCCRYKLEIQRLLTVTLKSQSDHSKKSHSAGWTSPSGHSAAR